MIQVWKFHPVAQASVRDTRLSESPGMLSKPNYNLDIRKNFFGVRVVSKWNSLLHELKFAENIDVFKECYDKL